MGNIIDKLYTENKWTRIIATVILIMFCIQYIPIETKASVSYLKLGISFGCILVLIIYPPRIDKVLFLFIIYYLYVLTTANFHPQTLRWSTLLFFLSFIITYLAYYTLITYYNAFDEVYFRTMIERLIIAYCIVLLIQQFFIIIGITTFPLINLNEFLDRGIGANALSNEPATAAITVSFAFLSLLRMYQLELGHKPTVSELFKLSKWPTICFLWVMLSMGSASAFLGLVIISLYFISRRYIIPVIIVFSTLIIILYNIDFTPINRLRDSFFAALTLDNRKIGAADGSAAARIIPMVNTITKLDLTSWDTWFGHGVDYGLSEGLFSDRTRIGLIADYGLINFILMQIIVYTAMIKRFFSIETLLWVFVGMATLANAPVYWGAMMLFSAVKHFQDLHDPNECTIESDESEELDDFNNCSENIDNPNEYFQDKCIGNYRKL